ncbi:MAG: Rha family transcriptional regulator [Oscillospiraceae bacterium]|nr:Rha family transcriptional regulator [Oscillospiraceae bacterium]
MTNIIISDVGGQLTVSSVQVADNFEKRHSDVCETIENLTTENFAVKKFFIESNYINERGREYKCYNITRDGFTLLVMGFTGRKALEWKLKYIDAFNLMEQELKERKQASIKEKTLEIEEMNARVKLSSQYLRLSKTAGISKSQRNALFAKSVEALTGGGTGDLPEIEFEVPKLEAEDDVRELLNWLTKEEDGYKIEWEYLTATEFINQHHQELAKYTAVAVGKALAKFGYTQNRVRKKNGESRRCRMLPVKKAVTCCE